LTNGEIADGDITLYVVVDDDIRKSDISRVAHHKDFHVGIAGCECPHAWRTGFETIFGEVDSRAGYDVAGSAGSGRNSSRSVKRSDT
jgi:hypothetical protein